MTLTALHQTGNWLFAILLMVILVGGQAMAAESPASKAEAVPEFLASAKAGSTDNGVAFMREMMKLNRTYFGIPTIKGATTPKEETISLANELISVSLIIDSDRGIRMTSIRTENGNELLSGPVACFSVLDKEDKVVKDGGQFSCESWYPRYCGDYSEVEIRLSAPERVVWRLRLYSDRPYLEQRFEMPDDWRSSGSSVRQTLGVVSALKPVMPNRVWERGFSNGLPVQATRNRFEFVEQSDHLSYNATSGSGLAAFVAGIGGQEVISSSNFVLSDHVTAALGSSEPIARFMLWPFEGPVETAFHRLRSFTSDEYVTKAQWQDRMAWTQFFIWQWIPKEPIKSAGPEDPYFRGQVTADRILDILPHLVSMGYEMFHLDAGWETGLGDDDWRFDRGRFPDGFDPIKRYLRNKGLPLYMWWGISDVTARKPAEVIRLIEDTDATHLFFDRLVGEETVPAIREIRKHYPNFTCMNHFAPTHSKAYGNSSGLGLNPHFLSELSLSYFGEEEYMTWSNCLPAKPGERFSNHSIAAGDLITRSLVYYAAWAMPFRSLYVPAWPWAGLENRPIQELANRFNTLLAARIAVEYGEDPRDLPKEALELFLDGNAFYKTIRPYRVNYQHVLGAPDGVHPDGIGQLKDGRGFIFLFNPGDAVAKVEWKELFWDSDLALDPDVKLTITDWTKYLSPHVVGTVDLKNPKGGVEMKPQSSMVLGVNIDLKMTLNEVKRHRSLTYWPPK